MVEDTTHSRIRLAEPEDAPALVGIDQLVNPSPWSIEQFRAVCVGGDDALERSLIVEVNGQPVGFVVFSRVLDEGCIYSIAVHSSSQGRGLGSVLLGAALASLKAAGITRCLLEMRESNTVARALYERHFFKVDGVRKNYYPMADGREDALLMSRVM